MGTVCFGSWPPDAGELCAHGLHLQTDLNALSALDRAGVKQLWAKWWERPAPPQASRALLIYALAYRIQQDAYGWLSAASRKRLRQMAQTLQAKAQHPRPWCPPRA